MELQAGDAVKLDDKISVELFLSYCEKNGITWSDGSTIRDKDGIIDKPEHWGVILVMNHPNKKLYLATTGSSCVKNILTIDSFLED